jgi:hypothetical protein
VSRTRENAGGRAETVPGIHPASLPALRRFWPALGALEREKEKPRTNPGRGSFETLGGAEENAERQKQDEQNISHAITSNVRTM